MRLSLGAAALALVFLAASAAAVTPHAETASSSGVHAKLSYSYDSKAYDFSDVQLEIRRGDVVLLDGSVGRPPGEPAARVWPANFWQKRKSVFVRDLDGDGEPEVFLALYWGGAHCCYYSYVYRHVDNSYRRVYHLWGDGNYGLRDLSEDRVPEFVSADFRFAYAFTNFADSLFPLQIWRYHGGRFVDVTRAFPGHIRRNAAASWRVYRAFLHQRRSVYGALAAWSADRCLLHRCAAAFRRLEALRKAGKLRGGPGDGPPKRYLRHLRRFLARTGYR